VIDAETIDLHPRYHLLHLIARGGMGAIYQAEQRGTNGFRKVVALKRLRRELLEDPESTALFVGEAVLVADLIHENIVQVYHLEQLPSGEFVIAMEYVAGRNLAEIQDRLNALGRTMPPELAAFVASRVCRGLAYAHKKRDAAGRRLKIVHRDVTPSNVLVSFAGGVKIADFGIAKAMNLDGPDEREVIHGKFPYMAPEIARFEGSDARSDIYALGLVLHELLTGRRVFEATSRAQLVERLETDPIPRPRSFDPHIPMALDSIAIRATQVAPEDRFESADEMGHALELAISEQGAGPTAETLAAFIAPLFPEVRKHAAG